MHALWIAVPRHPVDRLRGRMLRLAALWLAAALSGLLPATAGAGDDGPLRLSILLTSRRASGDLAEVLAEIGRLDPALRVPAARAAEIPDIVARKREGGFHRDPSGELLAVAQGLGIWPALKGNEHGGATLPFSKAFDQAYAAKVAAHGPTSLPNVRTSSFVALLRMNRSQIPTRLVPQPKLRPTNGGGLEPSPAARAFLCDPKVTLLSDDACAIQVIVHPLQQEPDILVPHTAFRVNFVDPLPRATADTVARRVRARLEAVWRKAGQTLPPSALSIVATPERPSKPRPKPQAVPEDESAQPPDATAFRDFWESFQAASTPPSTTALPYIWMFDPYFPDGPVIEFQSWLDGLATASLDGQCRFDRDTAAHAQAAASLLFPQRVQNALAKVEPSDDPGLAGGFIDWPELTGGGGGEPWYQAAGDLPRIAVAIATDTPQNVGNDGPVMTMVDSALNQTLNLLVVSAPARSDIQHLLNPGSFDVQRSDAKRDTVIAGCKDRPWPACLGRHKRVLVVAPEDLDWAEFALGASTVRLAVPARAPVIHPCIEQSTPVPWTARRVVGSSFAAPLAAYVIARVMAASPEGPTRRDPRYALWRVLVTARLIDPAREPAGRRTEVAFGAIDVARAIAGVSAQEEGAERRALIRYRDGTTRSAVVQPYPWNDAQPTITSDNPRLHGIGHFGVSLRERSTLVLSNRSNPISFKRVLRIARSPGAPDGTPLFDIYYFSDGVMQETTSVLIEERTQLGLATGEVKVQGHCSPAGTTDRGVHACLYAWADGSADAVKGFQPLNMTEVEDIVLPITHGSAGFVKGIHPLDFPRITAPDSPWRAAFCQTRVRRFLLATLTEEKKKNAQFYPSRFDELCR